MPGTSAPRTFTTLRVTDTGVIGIAGRIDAVIVIELERLLSGTLQRDRIVLDFAAATEVPPHTLTLLRGALRRALRDGKTLAVVGALPPVRSAVESCALDRVEFHRTASTALVGMQRL